MKKTVISALTAALVVGAASTTFAATNPFTDVPQGHWAYDAVAQLAQDGVIDGYGDSTFQGDKNITRYEMAQMVAKAMAKANTGNVSAADKAAIDKLAAEFHDELDSLGVRVSNLERNADKVKWNGEARYTYTSQRDKSAAKDKVNDDELLLRLEPSAEINDHWHVNARLDASTNMKTDTGDTTDDSKVKLERIYADGQYGTTNVKLGKLPMQLDSDLLFDDEISGASVTTGKDLKVTLQGGRYDLTGDTNNTQVANVVGANGNDTADMASIGLQYGTGKLSAGASYHHLQSDNFKNYSGYTNSGSKSDEANIWAVNGKYTFDKNVALGGTYAENTEADDYKKAGSVELDYKGAQPANKGTWGAYTAYRHLGQNVALDPSYDGAWAGTKGWEIGTNYTLAKNTVASVKYFNGEKLGNGKDAEKLFGRVEFKF